jgi:N-acetylglucosaminyl-diphospho-decaprenol L-rhamnosyltransferase
MLSVVIVTYNSESCVGACLGAVARSLPDAERLVVDNASADASRTIAESHGATVIALEENLGFGRACNVGAQRAGHEHVLFLNPDVAICSASADRLLELTAAPAFGLLVPSSTSTSFIFSERSWTRETLFLALRALRPRELPSTARALHGGRPAWASGAALLVRRSEFLGIGGFDPRYFLYYEDRDLSWKYRQHGLPLGLTVALVADHVGGGSSEVDDRRSNIGAFAILGWIQYQAATRSRHAAARSWRLLHVVYSAAALSVELAARILPSARLRRKRLQLGEVANELERICDSSGVLQQSDGQRYWPDAVAVLSRPS